jgi:hypothetical protein
MADYYDRFVSQTPESESAATSGTPKLKREHLNLICFDLIRAGREYQVR